MKSHIVFYGRSMAFCCGEGGRKCGPRWDWTGDGKKSIEDFLAKRDLLLQELNGQREIDLLQPCSGCHYLKESNGKKTTTSFEKIEHINYGYLPSVCQCRCIYCSFTGRKADNDVELAREAKFSTTFAEVMGYLEKNALLSDNFSIQVASGEITVHPERDELLHIVMKYPCHWFTNAFIYNETIAENLHSNKSSSMCVSLDCGTPETFKRIKGFNAFNKVVENLSKYCEHGSVSIKYLVIPGINDSPEDYNGIFRLLKKLGLTKLALSHDTFIDPLPYEVLESAALLYSMCKVRNISIDGSMFVNEENKEIRRLADRGFGTLELENYTANEVRKFFRDKELTCSTFTLEYRNYFFQRAYQRKAPKLKEFLGSRRAVIWGAGINGILLTELCSRNGIDVYVTDTNRKMHGTTISNKTIIPFSELEDKVDIILLSNGSFYDSVKEQTGNKYEIIDCWSEVK